MPLVETDAIVLHAFDYLESSRIVRLATRDAGVQSVIARGVRQSRSRFGGALDLFTSGVARFSTRPGRDLSTLSGFDVTGSRYSLASHLTRFQAASSIAELALRFSQDDPHDETFAVLEEALDALVLADAGSATDVGIAAAWRFVATLGFAPVVDRCAVCHAPISAADGAPFSHAAGGCVCPRCAPTVPLSRSLPADARAAIVTWTAGQAFPLHGDASRRAHLRLLREFLHHHVADGRALTAFTSWEESVGASR